MEPRGVGSSRMCLLRAGKAAAESEGGPGREASKRAVRVRVRAPMRVRVCAPMCVCVQKRGSWEGQEPLQSDTPARCLQFSQLETKSLQDLYLPASLSCSLNSAAGLCFPKIKIRKSENQMGLEGVERWRSGGVDRRVGKR